MVTTVREERLAPRSSSNGVSVMARIQYIAVLAALWGATTAPAGAQPLGPGDIADGDRYRDCLMKVYTEPDAAYEMGLAWLFEAGGMPAMHCSAAALVALGHHEEGATRLEEAAVTPDLISDPVRAELLAQAAAAWMSAEDPQAAIRALDTALAFTPSDSDLLIDRALAHGALEDFDAAAEDLSLALAYRPSDLVALRLRAQAWLELERYELAEADVRRALDIDEEDIETLLIRGEVRQKLGVY